MGAEREVSLRKERNIPLILDADDEVLLVVDPLRRLVQLVHRLSDGSQVLGLVVVLPRLKLWVRVSPLHPVLHIVGCKVSTMVVNVERRQGCVGRVLVLGGDAPSAIVGQGPLEPVVLVVDVQGLPDGEETVDVTAATCVSCLLLTMSF